MDTVLGAEVYQWFFGYLILLFGLFITTTIYHKSISKERNTLDKYRTRFGFNTEIEFSEVKDVNRVARREFHYNRRMERQKQKEEDKEKRGPVT